MKVLGDRNYTLEKSHYVKYKNFPKSVVDFPRDSKTFHPTQKPVALFEYIIKTYTNEGETVLDNCMGGFTSAVAADNCNRNWIGFELEHDYCQLGMKRINDNREKLLLPPVEIRTEII